ncbi:hypothetical protein [Microseira sp. BLCC-F43]|uniref:hypothetical protein n=1 Tax=Microseira sp. BLCC-F43 TaxID=3153602 RepID=UPI0035B76208
MWRKYSAYYLWNYGTKASNARCKRIEKKLSLLASISEPQMIVDELLKSQSAKQFLSIFKDLYNCYQWARINKVIAVNPLEWLNYELHPIYLDSYYLQAIRRQSKSLRSLECIYWSELSSPPTGQEMAKLRAALANEISSDYIPANSSPYWFLAGEPPTLLMTHEKGYRAIRKTAVHPSEYTSGKIRWVTFDQSYIDVQKQQGKDWLPAKRQATVPLSTLVNLSAALNPRQCSDSLC